MPFGLNARRAPPNWALVPIKRLARAKMRLAAVLTATERRRLSLAMAGDVLSALRRSRCLDGITVLGDATQDDGRIAALAASHGCEWIQENHDLDFAANLVTAARVLERRGIGTVAYIPADLPCLARRDVDALLDAHKGGVTVAVATVDNGSNALVCTPPTAIAPSYGAPSRARHLTAARERGFAARSLVLDGFARDVDRPGDLNWLRAAATVGTRTQAALQAIDLARDKDDDAWLTRPATVAAVTGREAPA